MRPLSTIALQLDAAGVGLARVGAADALEELAHVDALHPQRHVVLLEAADHEQVFHHLLDQRRPFLRRLQGLLELLVVLEATADPRQVEVHHRDRVLEVVDDELGELALLAVEPLQRAVALHQLIAGVLEAEQGADAGEQHGPIHRLLEELVRAGLEPTQARFALGLPRDEDDRDIGRRRPRPQVREDVDPVEVGHDDVEQDEIRRALLDRQERFTPGGSLRHLVAEGREIGFEQSQVPRLVVHEQDMLRHPGLSCGLAWTILRPRRLLNAGGVRSVLCIAGIAKCGSARDT